MVSPSSTPLPDPKPVDAPSDVEMSNLQSSSQQDKPAENPPQKEEALEVPQSEEAPRPSNITAATTVAPTSSEGDIPSSTTQATSQEAKDAITGSTTGTYSTVPVDQSQGPVCIITLLLTSGARHPYKLDEKYLVKRNVDVPDVTESGRKDPFSISVYTLKELILREWRDEWEGRPSSPSSIRLIHFGRLLDDKMALKECRFNTESPNVVHMTVRPQEVVDEEDASKGKGMARGDAGSERTAGCRCVIM